MNELLLIASIFINYGTVLLAFRFFGKSGIFAFTAISTILANIEVLILIKAFGMEQTLGNVLFAANFLLTDILSECYGKREANKAVNIGIFTSTVMIVITQFWLLYTPSENDIFMPSIREIFYTTPRLLLASFLAFAVSQKLDVLLYHKLWGYTEKKSGSKIKFLWLRNNAATLIAQIINAILFNVVAFAGIHDFKTLISIVISSYVIFIFTSLLDTPFIYISRKMEANRQNKDS